MKTRLILALAMTAASVYPAFAGPLPDSGTSKTDAEQLIEVVDIELGENGSFTGLLTSPQGKPATGIAIVLRTAEGFDVPTVTDDSGQFGYQQLNGGMYQLHAENSATMCRVWAPGTAPPDSKPQLLLVQSTDVAAGQWSPPGSSNKLVRRFTGAMADPITATVIVGTAIAVPVAIHNANKDDDGS